MATGNAKVRIVPVVMKLTLPTDGTTGWLYYDLDLPQIQRWGPYLEEIRCHTLTEARSANHEWSAFIEWSFGGGEWLGTLQLFSAIGANGSAIQAAFTDSSRFGLNIRLRLGARNASGTNREVAQVSLVCEFVFRT